MSDKAAIVTYVDDGKQHEIRIDLDMLQLIKYDMEDVTQFSFIGFFRNLKKLQDEGFKIEFKDRT